MDYEKKYKDALEWARKVMQGKIGFVLDEVLEKFPELKESEDERTKKEILDYIIKGSESLYDVQQYGKERFEKWIAWLEKQGEQKPSWNEEDGVVVKDICDKLNRVSMTYVGNESTVCQEEIKWLKSLKDRVQPELVWSKEDEEELKIIYAALEEAGQYDSISWLKFLKERYTWTPSDEQVMALAKASETYCDKDKGVLYSLYNDLKKLRER